MKSETGFDPALYDRFPTIGPQDRLKTQLNTAGPVLLRTVVLGDVASDANWTCADSPFLAIELD